MLKVVLISVNVQCDSKNLATTWDVFETFYWKR